MFSQNKKTDAGLILTMPSERRIGSRFHGNFRQADPLSEFLQFDYPPRRPFETQDFCFIATPSYSTKRTDRTSQFESPSVRRSTLELAARKWNFASRNKKAARRRPLCCADRAGDQAALSAVLWLRRR